MPRRFTNQDPSHRPHGGRAVFRWGIWEPLVGKRKRTPPGEPAPSVQPDLELVHDTSGAHLTWLGHAGFLIALGGRHFLVDPLLSRRIAGVYRNFVEPPLAPGDWPEIAAVLVSHCHYDHLDRRTLRALPRSVPAVVPEGLGRWFARWNPRPAIELPWWRSHRIGGAEITMVPARHWSRRGVFDVNRSHWGGFVLRDERAAIYHSGDSARFPGFAEIGERFPDLDAALLPVGAYEPAWFMEKQHLNPEQACEAFLASGARALVPMHWGSLRLTDEQLSEPIERVEAWWRRHRPPGRELVRLAVGATWTVPT